MKEMQESICKVCNKPLSAHELTIHNGVVGTRCSWAEGGRQYSVGELARLATIRRSLLQRAGRFARAGWMANATALVEYADFIEGERGRLRKLLAKHFAWGEE